jgi:hypothetical protein
VTLAGDDDVTITFGNYRKMASGGLSPGYWSQVNTSGGKNPVATSSRRISNELYTAFVNYLVGNPVTLVNNDGSPATYTSALTLSQYIGSGLTAQNMSAQLSRQTAAMILNILSGSVNGNAYYAPAGKTIQQIVNDAKAFLNAHPVTTTAGPLRTQAEQYKNWLDALNNGAYVIPPGP